MGLCGIRLSWVTIWAQSSLGRGSKFVGAGRSESLQGLTLSSADVPSGPLGRGGGLAQQTGHIPMCLWHWLALICSTCLVGSPEATSGFQHQGQSFSFILVPRKWHCSSYKLPGSACQQVPEKGPPCVPHLPFYSWCPAHSLLIHEP